MEPQIRFCASADGTRIVESFVREARQLKKERD